MSITVKIPTQLRDAAGGAAQVQAEGETVGEALESVFAVAWRAARPALPGRRPASLRERLHRRRGHPLPRRTADRRARRRRAHDPACGRGRVTAPAPRATGATRGRRCDDCAMRRALVVLLGIFDREHRVLRGRLRGARRERLMAITVKIPTQLRDAAGGAAQVQAEGDTVGEALESVFAVHGELRDRLYQDGDLRRFVNVYIGGEDIRFLDGLRRPCPRAGSSRSCPPSPAGDRRTARGDRRRAGPWLPRCPDAAPRHRSAGNHRSGPRGPSLRRAPPAPRYGRPAWGRRSAPSSSPTSTGSPAGRTRSSRARSGATRGSRRRGSAGSGA